MSSTPSHTRASLRREAVEIIRKGRGAPSVESAALDAEVLLRHVLGISRASLMSRPEEAVEDAAAATYRDLVRRRANCEPVAYLMGSKEFYGRDFLVSPAVLIPRPETELLVERAEVWARRLLQGSDTSRLIIVDVGIGSGAILLTLLKCLEEYGDRVRGIGIDLSSDALSVAESNRQRLAIVQSVTLIQGDLLEPVFGEGGSSLCGPLVGENVSGEAVLVVANPPYIGQDEVLMPDVGEFEPPLALFGGKSGTEIPERLLAQAAELFSRKNGAILVELGQGQAVRLVSLPVLEPFRREIFSDLAGIDRVLEVSPRMS